MTLRHLGYVSSESGPLILMDLGALPEWGGADLGNYQRVCDWLDHHPDRSGFTAEIGQCNGLVWDMRVGTADVLREAPDRLVLCHAQLERDDEQLVIEAASLPIQPEAENLGPVAIDSGWLLAFWPTARGSDVVVESPPSDGEQLEVDGVDDGGIALSVPSGTYVAWHDKVARDEFTARRCWILPEGASTQ